MQLSELPNRPVRRKVSCHQYPKRHVLFQPPRDFSRRERPARRRVHQHLHHHRRIEGLPAPAIASVARMKNRQIQRIDRASDEIDQVPLRQPLLQRGRQQQRPIRCVCTVARSHSLFYDLQFLPPTLLRCAVAYRRCCVRSTPGRDTRGYLTERTLGRHVSLRRPGRPKRAETKLEAFNFLHPGFRFYQLQRLRRASDLSPKAATPNKPNRTKVGGSGTTTADAVDAPK